MLRLGIFAKISTFQLYILEAKTFGFSQVTSVLFDEQSRTTSWHRLRLELRWIWKRETGLLFRKDNNPRLEHRTDETPIISYLTVITLMHASEAGITASINTILLLQWILTNGFKVCLFRIEGLNNLVFVIFRYYLPVYVCCFSLLPPCSGRE